MKRARGFAMMEFAVALTLFVIALGIGLSAYAHALKLRRLQEQRNAAREVLALSLERVRVFDVAQLPAPGTKMSLGLPPVLTPRLPGGTCELMRTPDAANPALQRLRIEVRWAGSNEIEAGDVVVPERQAPR